MIATFLALLWALFGEACHLYQKLLQIYLILRLPAIMYAKHAFTPLLCRQTVWAIYDDSRNFFSHRLTPDEFKTGQHPSFPVSLLDDIIGDVRYQRPIHRSSFPYAWREQTNLPPHPGAKTAPTGPSPFNGGSSGAPGTLAQAAGHRTDGDKETAYLSAKELEQAVSHVEKDIKAMMMPLYKKYNLQLPISQLAEAAGIKMDDLPRIPDLVNKMGKNNLCYNHVLGKCMHGAKCRFRLAKGHINGDRLPPQFVQEICGALKTGVDWCEKNDVQVRKMGQWAPRKRKATDQ